MRIAVLCSTGPLDRYGYQHIYSPVIENLSAFATRVYLYSTTRSRENVDGLLARLSNVEYVSNEATWFDADDSGVKVFKLTKIYDNLNLALEHARRDGMDCSFTISINQYIPENTWDGLRKLCQDMLTTERPFEWFYRRSQLGNRLFHTDTRQPHLFNLQIDNPYRHACYDAIEHRHTHQRHKISRVDSLSNLRAKDHIATVDCPLEMTLQDMADKMDFIRCYSDVNPEAEPNFDWNTYFPYYAKKFSSKIISQDPLDATGKTIARNSRGDFVSWVILHHYRKPTIVQRSAWFLHKLLSPEST